MSNLQIATTRGGDIVLEHAVLEALDASLRGTLIRPGDAGYHEARMVWNCMIDRRPGLIVRCQDAADVMAAVRFARSHDLLVSVRGGGHNFAGIAVCDGGMVVDLPQMKSVRVDASKRTARAEPGVNWAELDRECQTQGLATVGGTATDTGIAGQRSRRPKS